MSKIIPEKTDEIMLETAGYKSCKKTKKDDLSIVNDSLEHMRFCKIACTLFSRYFPFLRVFRRYCILRRPLLPGVAAYSSGHIIGVIVFRYFAFLLKRIRSI